MRIRFRSLSRWVAGLVVASAVHLFLPAQESAIPAPAVTATKGAVQILQPSDVGGKGVGGTGFVFGDGTHVLTFSSALGDQPYALGTPFRVRADENRILDAKLIWRGAPLRDWKKQPIHFVVLRLIPPAGQASNPLAPFALKIASADGQSKQGDRVFVIGYRAESQATTQLTGKAQIHAGINNALFTDVPSEIQFFQTNIPLEKGFQGGPVVDSTGAVVGLAYHRGTKPIETADGKSEARDERVPGVNYVLSAYEILRYENSMKAAGVDLSAWLWRPAPAAVPAPAAPVQTSALDRAKQWAGENRVALMLILAGVVILAVLTFVLVNRSDDEEEEGDEPEEAAEGGAPPPLILPVPPTMPAPSAQGPPPIPAARAISGPSLHGITGDFAGKAVPIGERFTTCGRDPKECQVVFPAETQGISRKHCEIRYNAQERVFILKDLGSNFGTFLKNGMKVPPQQEMRLAPGEQFYLGSATNSFEVRIA